MERYIKFATAFSHSAENKTGECNSLDKDKISDTLLIHIEPFNFHRYRHCAKSRDWVGSTFRVETYK